MVSPTVIGVLALQGDVAEHLAMLRLLPGVAAREVRSAADLGGVRGLILPGGESTTLGTLFAVTEGGRALREALIVRAAAGFPLWGTCMGAILLAKSIENDPRRHLAVMDIRISRNAYGAQLDSFSAAADVAGLSGGPFPLVFIRAPRIVGTGAGLVTLAWHQGYPVACRQGALLANEGFAHDRVNARPAVQRRESQPDRAFGQAIDRCQRLAP